MKSTIEQVEEILVRRGLFKKEVGVGQVNWYNSENKCQLSIWPKPETWMFIGQASERGLDLLLQKLLLEEELTGDPVKATSTEKSVEVRISNSIKVSTQVEFVHRYKDAPEQVKFLREWHRHILHITVEASVTHEERELEFIILKRAINNILEEQIELHYVEKSCETVGRELGEQLIRLIGARYLKIEVSEDGENGSVTVIQPVEKEEIDMEEKPWD